MAFINLLTGEAHGRTGSLIYRSYGSIHITQIRPLKKRHPSAQERQRAGAFFNTVRIIAELRNNHGFRALNLPKGERELNYLTSLYKAAYIQGYFNPQGLETGIFFQAIAQSANAYFSQSGQKLTIIQHFTGISRINDIQRIDVLLLDDWLRVKQRYLILPPYDSENLSLLNVAEKPEKVLIIYNYTDPQAGLCKGILFTSGEVMEVGQTPIGLISMYFGETPANCISLLCPKNTFFRWEDYPLLNCLEFKRQLDPFIAAGKCNRYTGTGFYAPDIRGLFPGFAGQNATETTQSAQHPQNPGIANVSKDSIQRHAHGATQGSHSHRQLGVQGLAENSSSCRISLPENGNLVITDSEGSPRWTAGLNVTTAKIYRRAVIGLDGDTGTATPVISINNAGDYTRPMTLGINLIVRYQ